MIAKLNLTIANVFIVGGARPVVVDTGAPGSAPKILAALAKQGFQPADVGLILLTHAHSDHAGSAAALRQATGAPVAIHHGDLAMLRRGDNGRMLPTDFEARLSQRFVDKPFPALEPDMVLDDDSDLRALGLDADLLATPGHSPGSISLLFANGDAIVGEHPARRPDGRDIPLVSPQLPFLRLRPGRQGGDPCQRASRARPQRAAPVHRPRRPSAAPGC